MLLSFIDYVREHAVEHPILQERRLDVGLPSGGPGHLGGSGGAAGPATATATATRPDHRTALMAMHAFHMGNALSPLLHIDALETYANALSTETKRFRANEPLFGDAAAGVGAGVATRGAGPEAYPHPSSTTRHAASLGRAASVDPVGGRLSRAFNDFGPSDAARGPSLDEDGYEDDDGPEAAWDGPMGEEEVFDGGEEEDPEEYDEGLPDGVGYDDEEAFGADGASFDDGSYEHHRGRGGGRWQDDVDAGYSPQRRSRGVVPHARRSAASARSATIQLDEDDALLTHLELGIAAGDIGGGAAGRYSQPSERIFSSGTTMRAGSTETRLGGSEGRSASHRAGSYLAPPPPMTLVPPPSGTAAAGFSFRASVGSSSTGIQDHDEESNDARLGGSTTQSEEERFNSTQAAMEAMDAADRLASTLADEEEEGSPNNGRGATRLS